MLEQFSNINADDVSEWNSSNKWSVNPNIATGANALSKQVLKPHEIDLNKTVVYSHLQQPLYGS